MRYSTLASTVALLAIATSPLYAHESAIATSTWRAHRPAMLRSPRGAGSPHAAGCAALGNYPVGPRAAMQARVAARQAIEPPPSPWKLAGNVILTAYSGCGRPTAGTFSIQGVLMGGPEQQNGITVNVPCALSCLGPALATISGHGAFRQDAAHPRDPLYVTITATLTSVVAKRRWHAGLTNMTGYLEVKPAQHARLSFLPPPALSFLPAPAVRAGTPPVPLVIYGWRGM